MAKKKEEQPIIRPDTCAKCKRSSFISVKEGDPRVIECSLLNRRFVADSIRNCIHAI